MEKRYYRQQNPERIPVGGNKQIMEHFGKVATGTENFSLAHMHAPAGWSEQSQKPDFDEITIMITGRMEITIDDDEVMELLPGESFWVSKGTKVCYSNPYDEESEYWSVCLPAFSPDTVNREI